MIKRLLFLSVCTFLALKIDAQVDISISIENHESDSLLLAYYFADKILVEDTMYSANNRDFSIKRDTSLEAGMYLLVSKPSGNYYQILLTENDQEFSVLIDKSQQPELTFEGTDENQLFYDYLNFVNVSREQINKIDQALASTDSVMVSVIDQLQKDKVNINMMVSRGQQELLQKYDGSITAALVKSNLPFDFPEFEGTEEEIQMKKYRLYKEHYFDNVDLSNPVLLRTPVLDQRVQYYITNLTPNQADSIIVSLDRLLTLMEPSPKAYQYYLSHFLNDYGNSKYIGMDAVYVHLALNYYGKGKAPWVSEDNLSEIIDNGKRIFPILIGKKAPDFTVYKEDGSEVNLATLNNEYTVIVFWKPDCGHCEQAMPHVIKFQEDYKDKGVEVLTVCTYMGEKYGQCWEDVKAKGMDNLLNTGDELNRSGIFSKYYTTSTPKIFVLDKEKNILIKKVPAENLDAVMIELMKIDQNQEGS